MECNTPDNVDCTGCVALFTRIDLDGFLAELTLDAAAPVELATAAFRDLAPHPREAAPAAHEVAAVGAGRPPVALAAARPRRPGLRVCVAETARRLDEDEIVAGGPVESAIALDQSRALFVERHLRGGVVAVSQSIAGFTELRQLIPACPYTTRSRHAVALATDLGIFMHRLPTSTSSSSSSLSLLLL